MTEEHVIFVGGVCIIFLCVLAAMGFHIKFYAQPLRTAELIKSAPNRRVDKLA